MTHRYENLGEFVYLRHGKTLYRAEILRFPDGRVAVKTYGRYGDETFWGNTIKGVLWDFVQTDKPRYVGWGPDNEPTRYIKRLFGEWDL